MGCFGQKKYCQDKFPLSAALLPGPSSLAWLGAVFPCFLRLHVGWHSAQLSSACGGAGLVQPLFTHLDNFPALLYQHNPYCIAEIFRVESKKAPQQRGYALPYLVFLCSFHPVPSSNASACGAGERDRSWARPTRSERSAVKPNEQKNIRYALMRKTM